MKYEVEITNYHNGDDITDCETFDTLQAAVDWINFEIGGRWFSRRVWINDKEVKIKEGVVVGNDGIKFCTNQTWHDLFAPENYPRIGDTTNVNTLQSLGVEL